MTRKSDPRIIENEVRMKAAIAAYRRKEYSSVSAAADAFDVAHSTLHHRVRGRQSRRESLKKLQVLTSAEEDELI